MGETKFTDNNKTVKKADKNFFPRFLHDIYKRKMAVSIRKSSGNNPTNATPKTKSPMREKIVQMYDVLLKGEPPSTSSFGETFWSEFFLLKPKINHFENELCKLNHEQVA